MVLYFQLKHCRHDESDACWKLETYVDWEMAVEKTFGAAIFGTLGR